MSISILIADFQLVELNLEDVGGGSVPNGTRHSLARIPLRWMIRECFRCNTGIIFDAAQLQAVGLRVTKNDFGDHVLGDLDRKSTRLNSSHSGESRMPSSA